MICSGAVSIVKRLLFRPDRSLAALLLASCAHASVGSAAETVDCHRINMGRLDVVLASGSSILRTVEMNEGDTLAFRFRGDTHATGTIALDTGDGRERRLLHGLEAGQVSYTAERSGAVRFRLATRGGSVASFVTTCNPRRVPGAWAVGDLKVDMSEPLSFDATASQESPAPPVVPRNAPTLQWLGGEQAGKDAPAGTYGVNLKLQPAIMIGVLAQFDQTSDPLVGPPTSSDRRWQAGPVTSVQLGGGVTLDARAAWGGADPVVGHATDRQAVDARLSAKQEAGPWRFSSSVGFARVQERSAEHSADVPSQQTVETGRVDVKPEMAYRIEMGHSMYIEPKVMVGTFWNLGDAATSGIGAGAQHEVRRMAETGITFGTADGTKLQVGGGVQEGEVRSESVWSAKMRLNIPLR